MGKFFLPALSAVALTAILASPSLGMAKVPPHGAPAPEIGASTIGLAMAVAIAAYLRRRRKVG